MSELPDCLKESFFNNFNLGEKAAISEQNRLKYLIIFVGCHCLFESIENAFDQIYHNEFSLIAAMEQCMF